MTVAPPSTVIKLFGTEEPRAESCTLSADPLSVELEAENLRYARIAGNEATRSIAFVVRGAGWQNFYPVISNLSLEEGAGDFRVSYDATVDEASGSISFHTEITGSATGGFKFNVRVLTGSNFKTNRTGFVILHPVEGVAGQPCTIPQAGGTADGALLWLAKLTPKPQQVTIAGLPAGAACIEWLDENNFTTAVCDPAAFAADYGPLGNASALDLGACAILPIELEAS